MWLYQTGQSEAALVKAEEALRLTERELGPDSLATNTNLQLIGMVSVGLGRFDEAERALKLDERVNVTGLVGTVLGKRAEQSAPLDAILRAQIGVICFEAFG